MSGKIQVIVGGQFGSEGKGHAAAELAKHEGAMLAIRTGGPNAGHTAWSADCSKALPDCANGIPHGHEYKLRQLPVAPVVNPKARMAIAARSLVDLEVLEAELGLIQGQPVYVDYQATILEPRHREREAGDPDLEWGSTRKGIGEARMDRLHRTARTWGPTARWNDRAMGADVADLAWDALMDDQTVQIEAAQGYGLGLHTKFYPRTTSADCRAIDALADVGLSPWARVGRFSPHLEVWIVIRPYPIRVAGDSGPLWDETSWEALGLPIERTTVTNKVRRVGTWDGDLVADAVRANGGPSSTVRLWLNMADQIAPSIKGATSFPVDLDPADRDRLSKFVQQVEKETGGRIAGLGTGPDTAVVW